MKRTNIRVPAQLDWSKAETVIDHCIDRAGLRTSLKTSLRAFPGSVHWHLKRGKQPGTLELTQWPAGREIWYSVQSGRRAAWIGKKLDDLVPALEAALK